MAITIAQIHARSSMQSYGRGAAYYRSGAISHTVRRGSVLEARCAGSTAMYQVSATFDARGDLVMAGCTCAYDWGGDCKHIVALLLTVLHTPDVFEEF